MIRNMKVSLQLMGAVMLTTVTTTSIVACKTATSAPFLNDKYAVLLGWYGHDNKSSINNNRLFSLYVLFLNFIT